MSGPPMSPPPPPPMRGPRSGEPLPPDPLYDPMPQMAPPPPQQGFQQPTGAVDAAAVRRTMKETDGLYRSRKPIFIAIYGVIAGIADLLLIKPFFTSIGEIQVLAPLLAMFAFPLLALGMYGLSTGAATAVQFQGGKVWLRLPLAYIPIGIGLLIAAGTAAK